VRAEYERDPRGHDPAADNSAHGHDHLLAEQPPSIGSVDMPQGLSERIGEDEMGSPFATRRIYV